MIRQAQAKPLRFVCFGEALWDLRPDGPVPGGAPMNVALRLAQLGNQVTLVSRVGDDDFGRRLLDFLDAQGLDTGDVEVDPRVPTGCVNVDVSDPHEVRYEIVAPAAWDFIACEDDPAGRVGPAGVVVFGSLAARCPTSRSSLLRTLESASLRVFDVNLRPPHDDRETIELLLERADWAKFNEHEIGLVAGWHGDSLSLPDALESVASRYALEVVCVTLGRQGALMWQAGRIVHQPGFDVQVVDTIGCGDSFLACWLSDLLAGRPPEQALRHACAMGAIVATRAGATPLVTPDELRALTGD